jgi:hypothetical protein
MTQAHFVYDAPPKPARVVIPVNVSVEKQDRKRLQGQAVAVYERLLLGSATGAELLAIAPKYTCRTSEIRKWMREQGGDLVATRLSGGTWRYDLVKP